MIYFLSSSPFTEGTPYLNPANDFLLELRRALPDGRPGLFVCADPDIPDKTDRFCADMRFALEHAGFSFASWRVLDRRTLSNARELVSSAGLMVLAGGHVPTQNAFFQDIGLRSLLQDFDGVVLGISAGSMNCADMVYAQPEEPGEAISPDYRRFLPGLGITKTMLLPHLQKNRHDRVDGLRIYEDIACSDSVGRVFYALPDGSYLLGRDGREEIRGEAYRIAERTMQKIAQENDVTHR